MGNTVSYIKPDDQIVQGIYSNKCTSGTITDNYKVVIDISELFGQGKNIFDPAKFIDDNSVYRATLGVGAQIQVSDGWNNISKQSLGVDHNWYAFDLDTNMTFNSITKNLTSPPTSLRDVINQPWMYCRPGSAPTQGYPRMFRMDDTSLSVNNRIGKIVTNGLAAQTYLNEASSRPREISTDNFQAGEFNVYKNYLYVYRIYDKNTFIYTTYYFLILETNEKFWMRCCANNVSQSVIGYCPTQYINNDNRSCDLITTCICTDGTNKFSTEMACGCYDQYVQKYIDTDPQFKNYLTTKGLQFPASCSKTCSIGTAYMPQSLKPCNMTICSTDMGSSSNLAGDKLTVLQNCGSGSGVGTNTQNPGTGGGVDPNANQSVQEGFMYYVKEYAIYEILTFMMLILLIVICYLLCRKPQAEKIK